MHIQRGINLGMLHQQLGIHADSRIAFQLTPTGVVIWDFGAAKRFTVDGTVPSVVEQDFVIPDRMKQIFNATDEQLKKRWDDGFLEGWTDERETIFSELVFRGVNMLPGRR